MKLSLIQTIARLLRDTADKLDAGNSEMSESQAVDILAMLTHVPMSKSQACEYLNLSRSRFDDFVREKKIPKGRKSVGFKELSWYKDELDEAVRRMNSKK